MEHISVRSKAWNYLSSFLSRQNMIISMEKFTKCLDLVLRFYNTSKEDMGLPMS